MNAHDQLERQLRVSIGRRGERDRPAPRMRSARPRGGSALWVAFSVAVAIAVAVIAVGVFHRGRSGAPVGSHPGLRSDIRAVAAGSVRVGPAPAALLSVDGSLWVAGHGYVARLNPATGRVEARTPVPTNVVGTAQLAAGAGSIWASYTGSGWVLRIDPQTGRLIAKVSLGGVASGGGAAFIGGRLWVARDTMGPRGDVVAVDPRTGRVVGAPVRVGAGPGRLAAGLGALWVQNTSSPDGAISRVDPSAATSTFLPFAGGPSVGFGSLWATPESFTVGGGYGPPVRRYDPTTRRVIARIQVPRAVQLTFGAGRVWVVSYPRSRSSATFQPIAGTATLTEIDPHTNRIEGQPVALKQNLPMSIAVDRGDLWIATHDGPLLHFKLQR